MDFFAWVRLLGHNRFAVSFSKLPQVLLITLVAVLNTSLRWLEVLWYGAALRKIEVGEDPIFIIGHWRTGTTMLHELLALDSRNRCPTTYECLSPNHFLLSERIVRRLASWMLPRTRPFDNMRMSFDRPQEDEAALCLRGQPSPFLTVAFPGRSVQDQSYVTLEGLTKRQLSAWKAKLLWFLKLLLYKKPGRLVLKSPQHTFRLPVLNEMFPRAKFVYLVRDPYVVYPSTVHFWTTMYEIYGLQDFDDATVEEFVLSTFEQMHTRMEATRDQIPSGRFFEMRYEKLAENPLAELEQLYDFLDSDFEYVRPAVEKYAERSKRYRTNEYELDESSREAVTRRWAEYIEKHGYERCELPAPPEVLTT
ncbi:sulfotransferase family protein [Bythopirellula polymerisocia]|nr:sulfotransferase [Bythopirellula polymerisocia]